MKNAIKIYNDTNEYRSNDFYLCACILASGMPIKRIERGTGKFMVFVFDDPMHKAEKIITQHWNRKLIISTRTIVDAIRELKTRVHSEI